ncbi:MAG: NAD(P)(+) transhydrogenase (Re/Si-specific) subunit alpha, partial [Planctomycetaceae bacterium]|nr:NAD(P)(+) transhydrogenase (Re/Si-specific) subunit alpha [Planctomycetaceae bacterium]
MVEVMPPGAVLVDLAAERGGNCELTRPGETVTVNNVTILGPMNLPSDIPRHASQMYSNNLTTFLKSLIKDGQPVINLTDECIAGTLVTRGGDVVHPLVREVAGWGPLETPAPPAPAPPESPPVEEPADTFRLSDD